MLATLLVVRLIFQSLVGGTSVESISLSCPIGCKCKGTRILSCSIESVLRYPDVGKAGRIEKLSVSSCLQRDFDSLNTEGYHRLSHMQCNKLTLLDGKKYSNCVYWSAKSPTQGCIPVCSNSYTIPVSEKLRKRKQTRKCMCFTCRDSSVNHHRGITRVRRNADNAPGDGESNLHSIIIIGALSIIAFLINFIVMIKLCCSKLTLIDLFGTALMLFNVILSLYGMSMAFYLYKPSMTKHVGIKYCQFFTSIKLFSLGAALYTMTFLTFHRPIRQSSGENQAERGGEVDEAKEEAAKKDAVFKGIVLILEGVMLAGVLGVLSWIKRANWGPLCIVNSPKYPAGGVDEMLHGIEIWYYAISGLLICWYIGNYIYRKYKIFIQYRETLKRKQEGESEDECLLTNSTDQREIAPYIVKDFPIFILVSISFCIWIGGFVTTLPNHMFFRADASTAPVIRVCTLLLPIILQPFIYVIRDTCCFKCPCLQSSQHRPNTVEEIKLTNPSHASSPADNNTTRPMTTKFDNVTTSQMPLAKVESDLNDETSDDEEHERELLNKKRVNTNEFELPVVICRSPNQSQERISLLEDTDDKTRDLKRELDENKGLLNGDKDVDVNGRVSRGPTFYPIAEKEEVESKVKSLSPIIVVSMNDTNPATECSTEHPETLSETKEWDPDKFEGIPSPTSELTELNKNEINKANYSNDNNYNNNCDDPISGEEDSLLNSSNSNSSAVDVSSSAHVPTRNALSKQQSIDVNTDANHTPQKLKKPLLTRDNSGSVER